MSESFTSFINLCGFVHQLKPVLDYIAHQENADSSLAALMGWDVMEVGGGGFWVTETSCPLQYYSIRGQPSEPPLSLLNIQPPSIIKCSLFELEECCDSKINVLLMHGVIRRA